MALALSIPMYFRLTADSVKNAGIDFLRRYDVNFELLVSVPLYPPVDSI